MSERPGDMFRHNLESELTLPEGELREGEEKVVYDIKHDPEHVVGKYHETEDKELNPTPRQLKGTFYLMKILHLLFPQNVPNFEMAASNPPMVKVDKVIGETSRFAGDMDERLALLETIDQTSVELDGVYVNFKRDASGNLVYVDTVYPWNISFENSDLDKPNGIIPNYSSDILRSKIMTLPEGEREQALSYLDRINTLLDEEIQALKSGTLFEDNH